VASYKLLIKPSAAKEIELAPKKDRFRIIDRFYPLRSASEAVGCMAVFGGIV
jgi:hypothetical protein